MNPTILVAPHPDTLAVECLQCHAAWERPTPPRGRCLYCVSAYDHEDFALCAPCMAQRSDADRDQWTDHLLIWGALRQILADYIEQHPEILRTPPN